MSDDRIELDVTLRDRASAGLDDIADDVAKLEKATPEIEVTADTGKAERDLKDVSDDVTRLEKNDAVVTVRAQIDDAKAQLKELQAQQDRLTTGDGTTPAGTSPMAHLTEDTGKAKDAMHGFVGEAITELPGVGAALGPASEAVGQITEGLLAGEVAMGGLAAAALPIAGIVVIMQALSAELERAKKVDAFNKQQVTDYAAALKDAATDAAGLADHFREIRKIQFVETSGDIKDVSENLKNLKLNASDFATFVTDDHAFEEWKARQVEASSGLGPIADQVTKLGVSLQDTSTIAATTGKTAVEHGQDFAAVIQAVLQGQEAVTAAQQTTEIANAVYGKSVDGVTGKIKEQKKAFQDVKGALDLYRGDLEQIDQERGVEQAIADFTAVIDDQESSWQEVGDANRTAQEKLIDYADTQARLTPALEKKIKVSMDHGDLQATLDLINQIIAAQKAIGFSDKSLHNPIPGQPMPTMAPTVNVNLPRGTRGIDTTGAASTRRHGRRYGNPVITYASR